MADASTCELNAAHPPKEASLAAFTALLPAIKHSLVKLRHKHDAHEPAYFSAVRDLSDAELAAFSADDLVAVRVGKVAYGIIEFGKLRIPAKPGAYVFVRWFVGGKDLDGDGVARAADGEVAYKFHSFYTEEKETEEGKMWRAIMGEDDELQFFNE